MIEKDININELKKMLKRVVWEYDIPEDELVEIFLYDRTGHSIDKTGLEAKILGYYNWHLIVNTIGLTRAVEMLRDNVIACIFPKSYQTRLYGLRRILSGQVIPNSG